jgi:hypothetical protein
MVLHDNRIIAVTGGRPDVATLFSARFQGVATSVLLHNPEIDTFNIARGGPGTTGHKGGRQGHRERRQVTHDTRGNIVDAVVIYNVHAYMQPLNLLESFIQVRTYTIIHGS